MEVKFAMVDSQAKGFMFHFWWHYINICFVIMLHYIIVSIRYIIKWYVTIYFVLY